MKKGTLKTSKIALVIASFSMLIAAVNMLVSALGGLPMGTSITLMLCMITIFFANLSLYAKRKKEQQSADPTEPEE